MCILRTSIQFLLTEVWTKKLREYYSGSKLEEMSLNFISTKEDAYNNIW